MSMPGFTADAAVYASRGRLSGARVLSADAGRIAPQDEAQCVICKCEFGDGGIYCHDCRPCDPPPKG